MTEYDPAYRPERLRNELAGEGVVTTMDLIDRIIDYENGDLDDEEVLMLFSQLIADGTVWSLQGSYGRQAVAFIEAGLINPDGGITEYGWEVVSNGG